MSPSATIEVSDPKLLPARPEISVVLITYKHERFIAQAIEGILAQRCDVPFEIVVGEDCSPDRTQKIVSEYQRRFPQLIRIITARTNVGMHANVDRSILAARGRYIALCDGDDYWHHPRKLAMQYQMMSSDPSMTLCHTDYDRLTRVRRHPSVHRTHPTPWLAKGNAYLALLHEWSVMTATSMYRSETLKGFFESGFHNTSWGFYDRSRLLYASLQGNVGYVDESTATYRKVQGSACNGADNSAVRMKTSVEECIELFLQRHPVRDDDARKIRAIQKRRIYTTAFLAGNDEVMNLSFAWLEANMKSVSHAGHRLRKLAISTQIPLKVIQLVKNLLDLHITAFPS